MSWLTDIVDIGAGAFGYDTSDSWYTMPDNFWGGSGKDNDSFMGGLFSGESLLGTVGTIGQYGQQSALNDRYDSGLDFQREQFAWQQQNAEAAREHAMEMAAAQSAAAKEIAAMQIAFQKQLAQYQNRVASQAQRSDTARAGAGQTANAILQLGNLAQRPYL